MPRLPDRRFLTLTDDVGGGARSHAYAVVDANGRLGTGGYLKNACLASCAASLRAAIPRTRLCLRHAVGTAERVQAKLPHPLEAVGLVAQNERAARIKRGDGQFLARPEADLVTHGEVLKLGKSPSS
jgi:hypothetical protein